MTEYNDKYLNIKNHRLHLYEPGYEFAALLNLLLKNPLRATYQSRNVLFSVATCLRRHSNESTAILQLTDEYLTLPLILSYLHPTPNLLHFYLSKRLTGYSSNNLVKECAKKVIHMTNEDAKILIKHFMADESNKKIVVIDMKYIGFIKPLLLPLTMERPRKITRIFIYNYASTDYQSEYFNLQRAGLDVVEQADGSGYIDFL